MIVIPMAGESSRFFLEGYKLPKYQLLINYKSVFEHVILSFKRYFMKEKFIFVVNSKFNASNFVKMKCKSLKIKNFKIVELDTPTSGQAETVMFGIENEKNNSPIFIFNIDTVHLNFKMSFTDQLCDGYLEVFKGDGNHWSFIKAKGNKFVAKTTEKIRISDLCSNGLYYFSSIQQFKESFHDTYAKEKTEYKETFIAPMYNSLISKNKLIFYKEINYSDLIFCGTPDEYISAVNTIKN